MPQPIRNFFNMCKGSAGFIPAKILSQFFSIVPSFPGPRQQKQDGPFQGPSCSAVDKVIFSDPASACGPSAC